jgi:hypothetical protein
MRSAEDSLILTLIWVLLLSPIGSLSFMWYRLSRAGINMSRIHVAPWLATTSYVFMLCGLRFRSLLGPDHTSAQGIIILINLVFVLIAGIVTLFRNFPARGLVVGRVRW